MYFCALPLVLCLKGLFAGAGDRLGRSSRKCRSCMRSTTRTLKVCVWTSLSRTRRQGNKDTMSAREFSRTVRIVLTAVGALREERAVEKFYWRFCQVAQSGDKNTSFGIFRSVCCEREIVIIDGATFPECPKHRHLPTEWVAISESAVRIHLVVLPQKETAHSVP